jgi:sec-independent protein translocase protein TatB
MLPSLGFNEILIIGVLALVVIGPKDLPLLLRKLGRWTARLRGMAQEFRTGFDELARQAELDELKREVEALRRTTNLNSLANEITKPLPTLEDYAGVSKPAAKPSASPQVREDEEDEREGESASAAAGGPPDRASATKASGGVAEDAARREADESEPMARSAT